MEDKLYKLMDWSKVDAIIYSESDRPGEVLGARAAGKNTLVQAFLPDAKEVMIKMPKGKLVYQMEMAAKEGYFAALVPDEIVGEKYSYIAKYDREHIVEYRECYGYEPIIKEEDIRKFEAGIHYEVYKMLGAHVMKVDGVKGVHFAVWAPSAKRVSVVGDFNNWDGRIHQMNRLYNSGVFELFIPDVEEGANYKFEIKTGAGYLNLKADPYAFGMQLRPETASVVRNIEGFKWADKRWISNRKKVQSQSSPISVYELHLGSFVKSEDGGFVNYREIAPKLIEHVQKGGYTHVELLPVMEHPLDESWGYQVIGTYAPTARYGTPEDFMYFVNELHKAGIAVILDWVPAHFPKDGHGLSNFDGTCLYEHWDARRGVHPDWGTLIFDYGRNEVKNYLIANALYWVEQYHVDGIRMDAVASMLYLDYGRKDGNWEPNIYGGRENLEAVEFIKHVNSIMHIRNEGVIMVAEESTAWPKVTGDLSDEGLGFDFKWNMGWMNDFLGYIQEDPYFRQYHHNELTFSMIYAYTEKFMLVFSHDEVVHGKGSMLGKMPGSYDDKFHNLKAAYAYMMTHPGKKLLFMGQDIGEFDEWNQGRSVQWDLLNFEKHQGVFKMMGRLNEIYKTYPAMHKLDGSWQGFEWINCMYASASMLSFLKKTEKEEETLLVVINFANAAQDFKVGVPFKGSFTEIFNTDDVQFAGRGEVNGDVKVAAEDESDGRDYSIWVHMAPLSAAIFEYKPEEK